MATVQTWKCPKCGFIYKSPIRIVAISHPCRGDDAWGRKGAKALKLVEK